MAALRGTDRVGAAGIARLGYGAVVLRDEIDDVETEPRDLGKPRNAILEAGTLAGRLPLAARKQRSLSNKRSGASRQA
jgi:hypothetical protein